MLLISLPYNRRSFKELLEFMQYLIWN